MLATFLDGATVILRAIADPSVGVAWDQPSVLEEQTIGSLAGHLARGGVWVVGEYLDLGVPDGPVAFDSADDYFAKLLTAADDELHRAIRDRGAAIAATGQAEVVAALGERVDALRPRLAAEGPDRLVAVTGGAVIGLEDYLTTRVVEQVVHLDDLARSIGREPWPVSDDAMDVALRVGFAVGRRRRGDVRLLRALYRSGFAEGTLPVF